jgi:hypothetical protein
MEGALLYMLAMSLAMQDEPAQARVLCARGRQLLEDLGLSAKAAGSSQVAGVVELLAGDPVAAERHLRAGHAALIEMGETILASTTAALLADALAEQRRDVASEHFSELSEKAAAAEDIASQVFWRVARAKAIAARNELERAEALAREAVTLAGGTDAPYVRTSAALALGGVLAASGCDDAARLAYRDALAVSRAKGDVASARRARAALAGVARGAAGRVHAPER